MAQGSTSGRQISGGLSIVGLTLIVMGAILWVGLGPDRGMDARTIIVACFFVVGGVALFVAFLGGRAATKANRILATGVSGVGTVVSVTQTGLQINHQPEVAIDMMVSIPGREPYRATWKDIVPFILLARLDDPAFAVRVDPADPQTVVIAWDEPVPGGAS